MSELRTSETEFGLVPNGETFFHTPNCTGLDGGSNSRRALKKRKEMWPTPRTPSGGADCSGAKTRISGHKGTTNLEGAVRMWTTPVSDDTGHRKNKYAQGGTALSTQAGGKLNPMWVEWLMGWPPGWTDLKPLEMDRFQKWLDEHGRN